MRIQKNVSLKEFNTFGIDVSTKLFCEINSIQDLEKLSLKNEFLNNEKFILGGGSNILFTKNISRLVIKNNLKGISKKELDDTTTLVSAYAGEVWHDVVLYCLAHGLAGIENLSLIPGCIGAAPIQNIGAYGVEIKDVFHSLEAFNLQTKVYETFDNKQCQFAYRDSIFKNDARNKYLITKVNLLLVKNGKTNTSYGAIENELHQMGVSNPTIKEVSEAVCTIRNSKLPNPKEIGNAGSFFKNPIVSNSKLNDLREIFSTIISYKVDAQNSKLAAGWLIEQCGWKGKMLGNSGIHNKQALVIVNNGNATGEEIYNLSTLIINSVKEKFGVELEREVNVL